MFLCNYQRSEKHLTICCLKRMFALFVIYLNITKYMSRTYENACFRTSDTVRFSALIVDP